MSVYYRPIAQTERKRPGDAVPLAAGKSWFSFAERLERGRAGELVPAQEIPAQLLAAICDGRTDICGLDWSAPRLMGVLNVTPDSFSDGGRFDGLERALAHAGAMVAAGVDMIDVGGESTRPGADVVPAGIEVERVVPVIEAISAAYPGVPVSIDTRKASVTRAAQSAGACLLNDVTALSFDTESIDLAAKNEIPVCLMHAVGDPKTMQDNPDYEDVLLDVYDYLAGRVAACLGAGIPRSRIIVDPGIGFGKTAGHNLALIRGLSLFHGLGCTVMLGVSRKRFIGTIGGAPDAAHRAPGSIALGLEGLRQGVQMLRVHDIAETKQALRLWQALL